MKYLYESNGYQLFENSEGFIEGYKQKGRKIELGGGKILFSDCDRVVTTSKNPSDFSKFLNKKKREPKSIPNNNQLNIF